MSNIIEITDVNEALTLLRRAVEEKGSDYKDPNAGTGCSYFYDGRPGCIVGHVLSYKGLTEVDTITDVHDEWDDQDYPVEWNSGMGVSEIPEEAVTFSSDALAIFGAAQEQQDTGHTWGEALARAEELAQELAA